MKLRYQLRTEFLFSEPVVSHVFHLRPLALRSARQSVVSESVEIAPGVPTACVEDRVYGNRTLTGRIDAPHDMLSVTSRGVVEIVPGAVDSQQVQPYFLMPTALTRPASHIGALFGTLDRESQGVAPLEKALFFMHRVHAAFHYTPGVTHTATTAEAALAKGEGVCQDYAHVLIALLRLAGVPALYVAGLARGTGVTHAWVRACIEGRWTEFDPTHDRLADQDYLTLARGCDFSEAALERGVFLGSAQQRIRTQAQL
ncbi:MAG: transglutaminase domain-containing protein, partial [Duodenibacillus sp.]